MGLGVIAVAPTHKTAGQRPKPRSADETNGSFLGLGAPLGHQRMCLVSYTCGSHGLLELVCELDVMVCLGFRSDC